MRIAPGDDAVGADGKAIRQALCAEGIPGFSARDAICYIDGRNRLANIRLGNIVFGIIPKEEHGKVNRRFCIRIS